MSDKHAKMLKQHDTITNILEEETAVMRLASILDYDLDRAMDWRSLITVYAITVPPSTHEFVMAQLQNLYQLACLGATAEELNTLVQNNFVKPLYTDPKS